MTNTVLYNKAIETAAQIVLDEGGSLYLEHVAEKLGITFKQLSECITDRQQFSTQVSIKIGAKIWKNEGAMFGRVVETERYQQLCGAGQVREILLSSFYYSFKGHPDFWRWLHRFEQFVLKEKIPPEAMGEYSDQLDTFYPIFLEAFEKGLGDGTIRPEVHPENYYTAVCQALLNLCIKYSGTPILAGDTAHAGEKIISTIIEMAIHYLKR